MKFKKKPLCLSFILPLITIFFDTYATKDYSYHGLGLPFNFFWYVGTALPDNRFEFFIPDNIIRVAFKVEVYLFDVLLFYIVILIIQKIFSKIKNLSKSS